MPIIYRNGKNYVQEIFDICLNAGFSDNEEITNAAFGIALSQAGKHSTDYGCPQLKDLIPKLPFFSSHIEIRGGQEHIILKFDPNWKDGSNSVSKHNYKDSNNSVEGNPYNRVAKVVINKPLVSTSSTKSSESPRNVKTSESDSKGNYPSKRRQFDRLSDITYVHPNAYCELAEVLALPEKWYFGDEPAVDRNGYKIYPILKLYLDYTYVKLVRENKIKRGTIDGAECFAFNTGLVDKTYAPIVALCKRNNPPGSERFPWKLKYFAVMGKGTKTGKELLNILDGKPERADFLSEDPSVLYFNPHFEIFNFDDHILIDNCRRLPVAFIKKHFDVNQTTIDGITIDEAYANPDSAEYESYFEALQRVMSEPSKLRRMKDDFNAAQELAVKKAQWNYKTAVPTYFPTQDRMSLLLPLALVDESKVDVALVVSKERAGYQGQTILTMNQAYIDSRLITRPDSDWLTTENKDSSFNESDYESESYADDLE